MDELLATCLSGEVYKVYAYFAPQSKVKPYGVYDVISNSRDNHSTGQGAVKEVRYQIDVYGSTKSEVDEIALSIENKLLNCSTFSAVIFQSFGDVEDDNKTFKYVLDFKLWK